MTNKDEIAALKARVEELERANKPPEPFKDDDWRPYDPTANMSMPRSTMLEMANAVPDHLVRGIVSDHYGAPQGPSAQGITPSSQPVSNVRPGGGTGWQAPIPLGPPPGLAQADRLMDEQDRRDRAELIERDARLKAMQKLAEPKP
jgi:hypothetical protein